MKRWLKVAIGVGVVAVILAVAALFVVWRLGADESEPDATFLAGGPAAEIPDEQNAFFWLKEGARKAVPASKCMPGEAVGSGEGLPPQDKNQALQEVADAASARLAAALSGEKWDGAFITAFLDANRESLADFDRALGAPGIRVPVVLSYADGFRIGSMVVDLLAARAHDKARRGSPADGMEGALSIVELGRRWETGLGSYTSYTHGNAIKQYGLSCVLNVSRVADFKSEQLVAAVRRLKTCGVSEEAFRVSLREQCRIGLCMTDVMLRGQVTLADIGPSTLSPGGEIVPLWPSQKIRAGSMFKPNQVTRWMIEWHRQIADQAATPYNAYVPPELPAKPEGIVQVLVLGNFCGRMLCTIQLAATEDAIRGKCMENVALAGTRLCLAIRAYRLDKGSLPKTLDDLVPVYIDAVPADDFDGRPMRYDPDRKVVYSVGVDLKDSGGMTKEDIDAWWKEDDPSAAAGFRPVSIRMPDISWDVGF
ncbi:MAG: hypothetical protein IMZ65_03150 [Planctomycetes bacterium]|nr:hypothetical protein [Planctomycetota bacterium]